jgi:c-di-GMP-binding flagellar brake protein YcgR
MSGTESNRRHPRAKIPLLVQYRFSPVESYCTDYTADVSCGGMFIYGEQARPVGTMLFIQFVTRDGSRILRGRGRIVRVAATEGPNGRCGQAVEFVDFDPEDLRFLEDIVAKHDLVKSESTTRRGRVKTG